MQLAVTEWTRQCPDPTSAGFPWLQVLGYWFRIYNFENTEILFWLQQGGRIKKKKGKKEEKKKRGHVPGIFCGGICAYFAGQIHPTFHYLPIALGHNGN